MLVVAGVVVGAWRGAVASFVKDFCALRKFGRRVLMELVGLACCSWPGLAPAGDLLYCCATIK